MAGSTHAAVTPVGIRDGEPAALAALVERRANAVLAYCETVLGPQEAERAAAEAFARFRAAVATTEDPRALDPETLLLGATRHAAAALTPAPTPEPGGSGLRRLLPAGRGATVEACTHIPGLLAGRAEGALGAADRDRLARHLERHTPCRALAARAARAEQAYATPPERTVPTGALTEILLALAAAAPVLAVPDDDFDFGIDPDELPAPLQPLDTAGAPDEPEPAATETGAAVLPAEAPVDLEDGAEADAEGEREAETLDASEDVAAPATVAVLPGDLAVEDPDAPETGDADPDGQTQIMPVVAGPGPNGGVPHPRPARRQVDGPAAPPAHGLLYRYLLPGAFVAVTLLIVMAIAGVFSSDPKPTGAATTSSTLPAAPPPGAPPVSDTPSTPRTPAQDAAVRRAATAARKAREAKAAAARKKAAEKPPSSGSGGAATTGQAPPATTVPTPEKATGATTTPRAAPSPASPSKGSGKPPAAGKPPAGTAEQQPGKSSSALPGAEPDAAPAKDPGVFEEGATP